MQGFVATGLIGISLGAQYALLALGFTLIFGILGVVNFAHGALFMLGAFCAVAFEKLLTLSTRVKDPTVTFFDAYTELPYLKVWLGEFGQGIIDWAVPLSILFAIPAMLLLGLAMERGLIQFFYKRPHAEQILVTFGLAIVLQEIVKAIWGANPVPITAPPLLAGSADLGAWLGLGAGVVYPWWRITYLGFSIAVIAIVFSFLQYTTFGMVVRAGMRDRETVGFLGINVQKRFTIVFGIAAVVAGLAGVMYSPVVAPSYHMGMEFLVLSFVVVVVGGMGSLGGAILAGFMLGVLQSFASMSAVTRLFPGIDQIIIYLVAVAVLLIRPRGLLGRAGVMEG